MAPRSSAYGGPDGDRVHCHGRASTSPRCGFKWTHLQLQEALEEKRRWDDSTVKGGFDDHHYSLLAGGGGDGGVLLICGHYF